MPLQVSQSQRKGQVSMASSVDDIQEAEAAIFWDAILAALKTSYGVNLAMCMCPACT